MGERLKGKVAIVTGAARGMGAETARVFAGEGAAVVLMDMRKDDVHARAREIGNRVFAVHGDVREENDWAKTIAAAVEHFGGIDVLVNNAGIWNVAGLDKVTKADMMGLFETNVVGVTLGMQAVTPEMKKRGGGSIVNISSVAGLQGTNGATAYAASKWAVRGITKVAALELGLDNIRVNSIHPGAIDTPLSNPKSVPREAMNGLMHNVPLRRIAGPEEVAKCSLFLASDDSSYVNGAELTVDGGWHAGDYEPLQPNSLPRR